VKSDLQTRWLAMFVLVLCGTPARADLEVKVPQVPDSAIDRLVRVTAPAASCAAVSDAYGWLAIGHKKTYKDAHLSLFKLDAQGRVPPAPVAAAPAAAAAATPAKPAVIPQAPPILLKLPSHPALAQFPNYPLSLVFHPKLPLLYVWQDIESVTQSPAFNDQPARGEFDHLLIYNVAGPQPVLVQSQARGADFPHGMYAGSLGLDVANSRLYLPNLHQPGLKPQTMYGTAAYVELDAEGLPLPADPAVKPGPPPRVGASQQLHFLSPKGISNNMGLPHGMGWVFVNKDVVILGCGIGAMTCDGANRRAWSNGVQLHPFYGAGYNDRITGHPTLPVIYTALLNYNWLCCMEHVDGYLTLVPRRMAVEGATFKSYPVVLKARNELAVGGVNRLYLVALDEKGFPKPTSKQTAINSDSVEALAYSEKFDILYVAEEKPK